MDKFECIRAFKQVVESGGFAAAAREMGLTRSTVSKYVANLEHELGTQLFVRSTRSVKPTETGQAFYDRSIGILSDLDEAITAITDLNETLQGNLRINAPMSFGTIHLSKAVAKFAELHDKVHIELSLTDRFVDPIEEGYDVTVRISEPQNYTSLVTKIIARTRRVICASPDFLEKFGTPDHPGNLINFRCLQYGNNTSGSHWQFTGPSGKQSVPINCVMWSNNGEVLKEAALQGQGIAILPTFIADKELKAGRLIEFLPLYNPNDVAICAIYPRHRHLSAKVRLFVQFIIEQYGDREYW